MITDMFNVTDGSQVFGGQSFSGALKVRSIFGSREFKICNHCFCDLHVTKLNIYRTFLVVKSYTGKASLKRH